MRDIDANTERPTILCGGFPCQDVSNAGARAGLAGERSGLWYEFARIIRELRPRVVVVENVPGLLVRGMGDVLGDLAACGYDAEWDCVPAVAVGAPHIRDRVFIIAWATSGGVPDTERDELRERWQRHGQQHEEPGAPKPRHDGAHGHVADADVPGRSEQRSAESDAQKLLAPERGSEGRGGEEDYAAEYRRRFVTPFVADADGGGREEHTQRDAQQGLADEQAASLRCDADGRRDDAADIGIRSEDVAHAEVEPGFREGESTGQRRGRPRDGRGETRTLALADADGGRFEGERLEEQTGQQGARGRVAHRRGDDRLFGEWPLRSSNWEAEPDVGRVADGVPRRVDRLRSLGNAVVPQVAEHIGHLVVKLLGELR